MHGRLDGGGFHPEQRTGVCRVAGREGCVSAFRDHCVRYGAVVQHIAVSGFEIRHTAPAFLLIPSLGVRDRPLRIVITAISCYTGFAKLNYPGVSHQKS